MDIKNGSNQNFNGRAFFVNLNRNSYLDLNVPHNQEKLSGVLKSDIHKINNYIQNKPFDLYITKGDEAKGEYLIWAGRSISEVLENAAKFFRPTIFRTTCKTDNIVEEAYNAASIFSRLYA